MTDSDVCVYAQRL